MTVRFPLSFFVPAEKRGALNIDLPPRGTTPRQLVIFLHGVDGRGDAWAWLADIWRKTLPEAVFAFPDAHRRSRAQSDLFRWWALDSFEPRKLDAGVRSALPRLHHEIVRLQAMFAIGASSTIVGGFSQGAMVALGFGMHTQPQIAGMLAFGGMAAGLPAGAHRPGALPPVFLYHGTEDAIVPFAEHEKSRQKLTSLGLPVHEYSAAGVDHTIDVAGAAAAGVMMASWIGAQR